MFKRVAEKNRDREAENARKPGWRQGWRSRGNRQNPRQYWRFGGEFNSRNGNRTRVPQSSAQSVPNSTATAVLIKWAALDQRPEMLLERVAAGPGQLDGLADSDAPVLAGELDDL